MCGGFKPLLSFFIIFITSGLCVNGNKNAQNVKKSLAEAIVQLLSAAFSDEDASADSLEDVLYQ